MIFEFHISRQAREKYQFEEKLFATNGQVIFADFAAARRFAEKMSMVRRETVPASDINAMGLLDEVMHILIRQYEMENSGVMIRALEWMIAKHGENELDLGLLRFHEHFPVLEQKTVERAITLEEMLLLSLENQNPALENYRELFDDTPLLDTVYAEMLGTMETFFGYEPGFGSGKETLLHILRAPILASPNSLSGQLQYVAERWGVLLGDRYVNMILRGVDFLAESTIREPSSGGSDGSAPPVPEYFGEYEEFERFSLDKDWMPQIVLLAKNAYVWLDQLSKEYQRDISRLDQIPDEELDLFAKRGFSGLWLIGLWERSRASRNIKQRMGNPDAVASAYSLYDYQIAWDLGGQAALDNLRWRAWQRGIRLAADMVPNHMGIDSRWVVENPERFLSLDHPPYPGYSFNSENLSEDDRVGIYLEDHYYDHSDAAVVFKRVDHHTGDTKYIYHGNDGTSMPWNDTAQLNFLDPNVRETIIQVILNVARQFPVIRFDAAMTLAKKHIQRLWYPEPGGGGAIPSRAEQGISRAAFEAAVPKEFWREVVDRVATEVPDTLLLAEAFWLMEGYFVRTLGMHRVYNSAFMHMLRDEDNGGYRQVMKNTLTFDPQILKRYVNFMNNPDEETAVEQFGKSDKYFGICTLLATLPGLPMFGHGQVEGYSEKYGMEYRRAYRDEKPDTGFVQYHDDVIAPLLHRRYIFADVDNFLLYHFFDANERVIEDVFAYSNRAGGEKALIVYHNKYAETRGWIKISVSFAVKAASDEYLVKRTLIEGLDLVNQEGCVIFRDLVTGLEYIRSIAELAEKGLYVELGAYERHVFLDFRTVNGEDWTKVAEALNGAGVESMQAKWDEFFGEKDEVEEVATEEQELKKKKVAKKAKKKGTSKKGKKIKTGKKIKQKEE
ncbi:MAG: alpha-amylase [Anaerolineae bacterium]|jgi:glycosidase|nr:alpha-amylase [Anaerolineae bacterium]MBT7072047.1 alpha-amylase [Anaerolineae bacterium]MBT7326671.1 alpha-amylase [Anaerolineae bacterium]